MNPRTILPKLEPEPGARSYSLLCLGGLGVLLVALLGRGMGAWSLFPILVGALTLATRWRLASGMFLLALAGLLWAEVPQDIIDFLRYIFDFLRSPAPSPKRVWQPFRFSDVALCGEVLAYVAGHYRLQALEHSIFPPDIGDRQNHAADRLANKPPREATNETRSARSIALGEIVVLVVILAFCAVWAEMLRQRLSGEEQTPGLSAEVWQIITLVWLLGLAALLWSASLDYLRLRRLPPDEAKLLLQDVLWRETRQEQGELGRWLAWARRRRLRKEKR